MCVFCGEVRIDSGGQACTLHTHDEIFDQASLISARIATKDSRKVLQARRAQGRYRLSTQPQGAKRINWKEQ